MCILDYVKFATSIKIWEEALAAVNKGSLSFELAFIAIVESTCEAFPQGLLQCYSIHIIQHAGDCDLLGIPIAVVNQASVLIGFASMAKALTSFDFYGQNRISKVTFAMQAAYRLAEVSLRIISLSKFGALMRPSGMDMHANANISLPLMILAGFFMNYRVLLRFAPNIDSYVLWASAFLVAQPPLFLGSFDSSRLPLVGVRVLETLAMVLLVKLQSDKDGSRIRGPDGGSPGHRF